MKRISVYTTQLVRESACAYDVLTTTIRTPQVASEVVESVLDLSSSPVEKFGILALDTKNVVIGLHVLTIGDIRSCIVQPREVFRAAILNNAYRSSVFTIILAVTQRQALRT